MASERRNNMWLRHILNYVGFVRPEHEEAMRGRTAFVGVKLAWAIFGMVMCVTILFSFPDMPDQARRMLAIAVMMSILWLTEALPIAVTALIPLVAFPLFGIGPPRWVAVPYTDPNVFLFIGGFVLASCMQKWKLHSRLALWILILVGTSPRKILLSCMLVTAFLSMWASNTATVMMMFPIALALTDRGESPDEQSKKNFTIALLLGIAYAGSAGGMATLIGSPPNIVFASIVKQLNVIVGDVSFIRWMGIGLPVAIAVLILVYFMLSRVVYRFKPDAFTTNFEQLKTDLKEMGPMSRGEKYIGMIYIVTAILWITRKDLSLGFISIPGWSNVLPYGYLIHDSTVAIFVAILLFLIPVDRKKGLFLMDRDWFKMIPWDIVLLFGGGFALAQGFQKTGLSGYLGQNMAFLGTLPLFMVMLLIAWFMTFLTELTSNTATTAVMLPVLAASASAAGVSPPYYMLPAVFAASAAFMLPVATPPNAIVFATKRITIIEMARAGLLLNITAAPVIAFITWWLGPLVFNLR